MTKTLYGLESVWEDENGEQQPPLVVGADETIPVVLTDSQGWPDAAADGTWTWYLTVTTQGDSETELLSVEADSATISTNENTDDTLTLQWNLTGDQTGQLQPGSLAMGIHAENGSGGLEAYTDTRGLVPVRQWPGGLP